MAENAPYVIGRPVQGEATAGFVDGLREVIIGDDPVRQEALEVVENPSFKYAESRELAVSDHWRFDTEDGPVHRLAQQMRHLRENPGVIDPDALTEEVTVDTTRAHFDLRRRYRSGSALIGVSIKFVDPDDTLDRQRRLFRYQQRLESPIARRRPGPGPAQRNITVASFVLANERDVRLPSLSEAVRPFVPDQLTLGAPAVLSDVRQRPFA